MYKKSNVSRSILVDLTKEMDLKVLDMHLADYSYIDGYLPTQADNTVFDTLNDKSLKGYECYPHVKRWLVHIQSFEIGLRKRFYKSEKPLDSYRFSVNMAASDNADTVHNVRGINDDKKNTSKPLHIQGLRRMCSLILTPQL